MSINESTKFELLEIVEQLRDAILKAAGDGVPTVPGPVPAPAKAITSVTIENTGGDQTNVPVTFGQVFAPGDLPAGMGLKDAQLDVKATHPDGSVRHGIVSLIVPKLAKEQKFVLQPVAQDREQKEVVKVAYLPQIVLTIAGARFVGEQAMDHQKWLDGAVCTELNSYMSFLDGYGNKHPHLHARVAMRCYPGERTRADITLENVWAYEPNPQNFTYDVEITIGGKVTYSQKNLTHYHHARWRHVAWIGEEPKVHVRHDTAYIIKTMAVPNYDQSIQFSEQSIADGAKSWAKAGKAPMETGLTMRAMATTGGRGDIGIMPSWASAYLLTMDERLKEATIQTANLAGSFPMHYRDKDTGQPISLIDHPYMTLLGKTGDTMNPVTKLREAFPSAASKDAVKTPNSPDISHHPGLSYLPYLLTGDLYHLEELQFWAMYCVFSANPGAKYRDGIKGLLKPEQVRGQAWALRTLVEAAYITPDSDRLKPHLNQIVDSNLDWYNAEYTDNPNANKLGMLVNGYAVVYGDKNAVGPWQDDFFTQAVGHAAELGFDKAKKLLKWKAKFVTERMVGEGACWIHAAIYSLKVRDTATSPFFETIGQAYSSMDTPKGPLFLHLGCDTEAQAKALGLKVGQMTGYADGATGYPSNMQPALAYAADHYGEQGKKAWARFMARKVKPDYSKGPQFAIVPRTV